jgi:hypothetical protein
MSELGYEEKILRVMAYSGLLCASFQLARPYGFLCSAFYNAK